LYKVGFFQKYFGQEENKKFRKSKKMFFLIKIFFGFKRSIVLLKKLRNTEAEKDSKSRKLFFIIILFFIKN